MEKILEERKMFNLQTRLEMTRRAAESFNYANRGLPILEIAGHREFCLSQKQTSLVVSSSLTVQSAKECECAGSVFKKKGEATRCKKASRRRKGEKEADVRDEYLKYFWRENFGNLLLQDAANSSQKFMDPRRSLGRAS